MADETLRLRVTADTSAAEGDLRDLDRLADQVDLDPKVDSSGMDDLAESAAGLPGPLGQAATLLSGPAGIAAGAATGAVALFSLADSAADAALEAAALQAAVGGSVEESSQLLAATESVGLEYNDVLELIAESNKAIGANAEEARKLGVNLSGTPIERFQQLVDAVYAIQDPLERSAAASKFFGEEGSKQLPKLIGMYGDLSSAIDAVPDAAIMSEQDVRQAQEFKQTMAELKAEVGALATELGRLAIPALTGAVKAANDGWDALAGGVTHVREGLADLFTGEWDDFVNGREDVEAMTAAAETLGTALSGGVTEGISTAAGQMRDYMTAAEEATAATEELRDSLFTTADAELEASRKWSDLHDDLGAFREIAEPTRADVEKLNDSVFEYADAQLEAAGLTRNSAEGSKLYKDALLVAAGVLGDDMNPELQTYIDKALAVPDTAVTDVSANTAAASADIDHLTRDRTVNVNFAAAGLDAMERRLGNLASNLFGASRAAQQSAARYVWRNGRYVEV